MGSMFVLTAGDSSVPLDWQPADEAGQPYAVADGQFLAGGVVFHCSGVAPTTGSYSNAGTIITSGTDYTFRAPGSFLATLPAGDYTGSFLITYSGGATEHSPRPEALYIALHVAVAP